MTIIPLTCAACNKAMTRRKDSKPQGEAFCQKCRREGKALKHGTEYAYRKGCRCGACRENQRVRLAAYNRLVKDRDGVSARAQYGRKARGVDPLMAVACTVCGDALRVVRAEGAADPMHKACKDVSAFYVPRPVRLSIYERDEWTCTICNHPADRDAHYLTDWYPTLDHVVPQSGQIIPDHSPSNLRLAHRYCNLARGNRSMTDEEVALRADERRLAAV